MILLPGALHLNRMTPQDERPALYESLERTTIHKLWLSTSLAMGLSVLWLATSELFVTLRLGLVRNATAALTLLGQHNTPAG